MKNLCLFVLSLCMALSMWPSGVSAGKTFRNPVIYADVPDVDIIRVGSDYYMVSTTMHLMPGAPVMHSKDLVHWEIISYLFDEIKDSPFYDLEGGNVYGQGQWASSIRYHEGKFYVFFATNRPQKSYLYVTDDPYGKWELKTTFDRNYHDASLLFDNDGKIYLAYGAGHIRIVELEADLSGVKSDGLSVEVIHGTPKGLLEGTHIHKYGDYYYLFLIWWPSGGIRTQLCFRSSAIAGPYEMKVILSDDLGYPGHGVAQGTIVDTEQGDWYGFLFQDHEAVGRTPVLMPCRWEEGWPVLGDENGKVPSRLKIPLKNRSKTAPLVVSDDFDETTLALQWQWNHNPDNASWSLKERPGYLRLHTVAPVSSVFQARNTLSQRTQGPKCSAVVSMDVSRMQEGDVAGTGVYCAEPGLIEVRMCDGLKYLVMSDRGEEKARVPLHKDKVFLRTDCDFSCDQARFYYSLNGRKWFPLGDSFKMIYNLVHFMGNRLVIYNYATKSIGGYIDVDAFKYRQYD